MKNIIKNLFAGIAAVAVVGAAVAQSTPPNPNVTNPAVGAGQQSAQGTPMGTTGVQGAATGTTGNMGTANSTRSTSSSMSSNSGSTTMNTGSAATSSTGSTMTAAAGTKRRVKADRN